MKTFWKVVLILVVVFAAIQLVPYGRNHTNPAVVQEPNWDSPQTRSLAVTACYDCHSNETTWPWYSNIAPVSWLVQHDVEEARQNVNFSDINGRRIEGDELQEVVQRGEMPPVQYTIIHKNAILSAEERQLLMSGFFNTFGGD
ncbi:MAG TPA: heme-binding domain-containing protein [Bellilinea sp.]|nr:heme-binding domain-containing protein [Bellilinea sp.]